MKGLKGINRCKAGRDLRRRGKRYGVQQKLQKLINYGLLFSDSMLSTYICEQGIDIT